MSNDMPLNQPEKLHHWASFPVDMPPLEFSAPYGGPHTFTGNQQTHLYSALPHVQGPATFFMHPDPTAFYAFPPYAGVIDPRAIPQAMPYASVVYGSRTSRGKGTYGGPSTTPRRTLTDDDRRRMCLYHREHPHVKQSDIGAMFGVERSTVSKVLRNKERFLAIPEGNTSPAKKSHKKGPDVEKTLANYIRKQKPEKLSQEQILQKAISFSQSSQDLETRQNMMDPKWVKNFTQKVRGDTESRTTSVASKSSSPSTASEVATPATTPEVPCGQDVKKPNVPVADTRSLMSENRNDVSLSYGLDPSFFAYQNDHSIPLDPALFTLEDLHHRERTPSLAASSSASNSLDLSSPNNSSYASGYVSPMEIFQSPYEYPDWERLEKLSPEPPTKRRRSEDPAEASLGSYPGEDAGAAFLATAMALVDSEVSRGSEVPVEGSPRSVNRGETLKRKRD